MLKQMYDNRNDDNSEQNMLLEQLLNIIEIQNDLNKNNNEQQQSNSHESIVEV